MINGIARLLSAKVGGKVSISSLAAGVAALVVLSAGASSAAPQGNVDGQKYEKGATVTLQGCVVAGEGKDTYVFTGVKEWPISKSPNGVYGPRHYWFDMGPHDFTSFVGQTIQLKGPIIDLKESEIEREPGGWNGGATVAVELPGRDVRTTPGNAGVGSDRRTDRTDVKITLLKLKIEELIVVLKTCLGEKPR